MRQQLLAWIERYGCGGWLNRLPFLNRIRLRGNGIRIDHRQAILSRCLVSVEGDRNEVRVGAGARLARLKILIEGEAHRLTIGVGCRLTGKIKLEDREGRIEVGDRTTMEDAYIGVYDIGTRITIGRDCMFSEQVGIRAGDMHSIIDVESGKRINPSKDIVIGDHVWLGRGVTVLKGAHIGSHCVIGAHSVVTGDIPDHSLAVGIPAKVVRQGVTWSRDRLPAE